MSMHYSAGKVFPKGDAITDHPVLRQFYARTRLLKEAQGTRWKGIRIATGDRYVLVARPTRLMITEFNTPMWVRPPLEPSAESISAAYPHVRLPMVQPKDANPLAARACRRRQEYCAALAEALDPSTKCRGMFRRILACRSFLFTELTLLAGRV